jgi:ABC-type polysaccharide/polyol phosphate export permease
MRSRSRGAAAAAAVGRFIPPFLELQLAMALGALVCFLLGGLVRASSIDATGYQPGTVLFFLGDVTFLIAPVVALMILRGRKWRHSLELAVTMLAPVGAIVVVGELTASAYLLWFVTAMYPAMSFGMLVYMLYRANVVDWRRNVVSELAS